MSTQAPFPPFDFSALDDPEFKEDSVREEVLAPLLRGLGYSATGADRIVRSKALVHPFVRIGTLQHKVNIIPDYLLHVDGKPAWVLEAKAPKEDVRDPAHVAQCYSYAIHPEVRVPWYALSNGRELALYHVHDASTRPRYTFDLRGIPLMWSMLGTVLGPEAFSKERVKTRPMLKDLGIHLMKLGVPPDCRISFVDIYLRSLGRPFENVYSVSTPIRSEDGAYLATLDFDDVLFAELLGLLPPDLARVASEKLSAHPTVVAVVGTSIPPLCLEAVRGTKIEENEDEHFCPLTVTRFHTMK